MKRLPGWWRLVDARERYTERLVATLAQRLPRRLVYQCAIRVAVHATTGRYSHQVVPELTAMDALARWDRA